MTNDPAVQSVRVAVALLDRFADLLKGPTQVTAVKKKAGLFGVSGNQTEMSLRIGEAQQVYPEIWRHLDDARAGFARSGIDVATFDAIRAAEGQGLGAAPDTQVHEYGSETRGVRQEIKTANFNREGFARARAASIALMRATPQIDWGAIAKAEQHDPDVAAFGRATRRRRWMWFAILGIALVSPFAIILYMQHRERARFEALSSPDKPPVAEPLSGDELEKLRAELGKLRPRLAAARTAWDRAGTFGGLAAIGDSTAPCPAAPPAPPAKAADTFIRTGSAGAELDASAFVAHLAGPADRKLPNRELAEAERAFASIDRRVTEGGSVTAADATWLANLVYRSVVVIIDQNTEPEITQTSPITYKPGEVSARGYVFSIESGTFACAGKFTVRNPTSQPELVAATRRAVDAQQLLHRQLEIGIRQELAKLTAAR